MSFTMPPTTCGIRTRSPATDRDGMNTFRAIVFSSVVAGFVVGVIVTVIQQFGTVPLILKAEVYERTADHHSHEAAPATSATSQDAAAEHDAVEHDHAG